MASSTTARAWGTAAQGIVWRDTGTLLLRWLVVLLLIGADPSLNMMLAGSPQPGLFLIDSAESRVWFDADAPLHSFRGEARDITGSFMLQHTSPLQIDHAKVIINAASIETGNSARDSDMREDFLEVARFPTIELSILELLTTRPTADETSWDVVLQAQLTVHGTTRDVKVPATVNLVAERLTARGRVYLDMRDYQIRVPRLLLVPMSSEVLVGFAVVARPAR